MTLQNPQDLGLFPRQRTVKRLLLWLQERSRRFRGFAVKLIITIHIVLC